jgi:hypothetical protein
VYALASQLSSSKAIPQVDKIRDELRNRMLYIYSGARKNTGLFTFSRRCVKNKNRIIL